MFETASEVWVRLSVFIGVLVLLAAAERVIPRRKLKSFTARRWVTNMSIIAVDSLLVRVMAGLAVPVAAVAAAAFAETKGYGVFNTWTMPFAIEAVLSLLLLDLAIWAQHVASHKVPAFWRLHQVHHADRDIDVSTALRFHPIEIAVSMIWKVAVVLVLGIAPVVVVAFEVFLNACAMFSHANIALPERLDRVLRLAIVTPDMHRVHHSTLRHEHDSNYGFNLSIWDRLFRTYRAQPENGHENMTIGLASYQDEQPAHLRWSLALPFKNLPKAPDQTQTLARKRV